METDEITKLGNGFEQIDFDSYDDLEILTLSQELARKVKNLNSENQMFESYYKRVTPNQNEEDTTIQQQEDNIEQNKEYRREKKKKGDKQKEQDRPVFLTNDQKAEISTRELEELRDEIQRNKDAWSKVIDNYKAELEEVEIRTAEIKKAVYEFKRDIELQSLNKRTGKVIAERVIRYFEDKIRSKDAIIEKVRLKNVTLKVQKNKLHLQLKQKEEMGEVLHAIDFDQLQIENKQYMAKIEERNAELLKLKMTAGNTIQTLNSYKKKLVVLSSEYDGIFSDINQRNDLLSKLNMESVQATNEKDRSLKLNKYLLKQIDQYKVPEV